MSEIQQTAKRDSQVKHQRQFFWQILTPVLLAFIVVFAILVLVVVTTVKTPEVNEKWANICTIFISLPVILFSLLALGVVVLLAWLFRKLYKAIPSYSGMFFNAVKQANRITNKTTEKGLSPIIQGKAYLAGFKRLLSLAFHMTNYGEE